MLPVVAGIAATKQGLPEWAHGFGLAALDEPLKEQAAAIAGAKGKHRRDRLHHHWGTTQRELTFEGAASA